jgi:hypothetical protein
MLSFYDYTRRRAFQTLSESSNALLRKYGEQLKRVREVVVGRSTLFHQHVELTLKRKSLHETRGAYIIDNFTSNTNLLKRLVSSIQQCELQYVYSSPGMILLANLSICKVLAVITHHLPISFKESILFILHLAPPPTKTIGDNVYIYISHPQLSSCYVYLLCIYYIYIYLFVYAYT